MAKTRSTRFKIAIVAIVVLLIAAAGVYTSAAMLLGDDLATRVKDALASGLRTSLGRDVQIGSVEPSLSGRIVVQNLRIADGSSPNDGVLLSAPRVDLQLSLLDLLRQRSEPLKSVKRITVDGARVFLTQTANGKWNIDDLLTSGGGANSGALSAEVTVTNSRLLLKADKGLGTSWPHPVDEDISLTRLALSNLKSGKVSFGGTCGTVSLGTAEVKVQGTYAKSDGVLALEGSVASLSLPALMARLPASIVPFKLSSGQLGADFSVSIAKSTGLSIKGLAKPQDVSLSYEPMPLAKAEGVSGEVEFTENSLKLRSVSLKSGGGDWRVSGTVKGLMEPLLDLQCRVNGVDLSTANQISARLGGAKLTGRASGDLDVRGSLRAPRAYGSVQIEQGTVREAKTGQSLEAINGSLQFNGETVSFDKVACRFKDSQGSMSGQVEGFKKPSFDTSFAFDDFDTSVLPLLVKGFRNARISGRGVHDVRVQGTAANFVASGEVTVQRGSIWGVDLTDIRGDYQWTGKRFDLATLTANAFGGTLSAKGSSVWEAPGYRSVYALEIPKEAPMRAELISRHLSKAGLKGLDMVSGPTVGQGVWKGGPTEPGYMVGQVTVSDGTLIGHSCSAVTADMVYRQGTVGIERVSAVGSGVDGGFRAQGRGSVTVSDGANVMDVAFSATGAEISKVLPRKANLLSGRFGMDGQLSGTTRDWELTGDVTGGRARLSGLEVDAFSGNVALSPSDIVVNSLTLRRGMSTYLLTGRSGLGGRPEIKGYVDARDGTLDDIMTVSNRLGLLPTGAANGLRSVLSDSGRVTGQLSVDYSENLRALGGKIEISDMVVDGEPLKATSEFVTNAGRVAISQLSLTGKALSASISGTVGADAATAELGIEAERIPARLVERVLGRRLGLSGDMGFVGRLTGALSAPNVEGTVRVDNGSWKDLQFHDTSARVSWYGDHLAIADATAKVDASQYHLAGSLTFGRGAPEFDLKGSLTDGRISHLARFVPSLEKLGFQGTAVADFTLRGSSANPEGSVVGELKDLSCRGVSIGHGQVSLAVRDRSITIDKLELRQGPGLIQAGGIVDTSGQVNLDIQLKDYEARDIASLAKLNLSASLNLACQVSGSYRAPSVSASLSTGPGFMKGIAFSSLTATCTLQDGLLLLQSASLTSGQAAARATGKIPLFTGAKDLAEVARTLCSWTSGGIGDTPGMDVVVTLSNGSLGLLPLFTGLVESASGGDELSVKVGGTLRKPVLIGRAKLTNGKMQLKYISGEFDRVTADLEFVENSLVVRNIVASGPAGGASGSARVSLGKGGYGLSAQVSVHDLKLNAPLPGRLEGSVTFTQAPGVRPLVEGNKLVFSKGSLSVPISLAPKKAEGVPSSAPAAGGINPRLHLRVYVGTEVRLRQPSLVDAELVPGDSVDIAGTLREPTFGGRLGSHRGSFVYLGTTFKLTEASVELGKGKPQTYPDPASGTGDAGASGLIGGLSISGEVKGETTAKGTKIYLTLGTDGVGIHTDLRSSPPMEEREIRSLLSWPSRVEGISDGGLEEGITEEVQSLLVDQVRQYFVGGVEDVFKSALGLDEFKLEQSVDEGYRVSLGKYVNDRVFVTYTNGLSADPLRDLRIDYTLKPGIYLSAQVDSRRDYRLFLDTRFRF